MKFILYLSFESWDNFSAVRFSYFTQLVVYIPICAAVSTKFLSLSLRAAANIIQHLIQEHFYFLYHNP